MNLVNGLPYCTAAVLGLLLFIGGCQPGGWQATPTGDLLLLQGHWEPIDADPSSTPDWIEFSGNQSTHRVGWDPVWGTRKQQCRVELDETTDPKRLRLLLRNGQPHSEAVYEVEGNTLKLTRPKTNKPISSIPADWKTRTDVATQTTQYRRTAR